MSESNATQEIDYDENEQLGSRNWDMKSGASTQQQLLGQYVELWLVRLLTCWLLAGQNHSFLDRFYIYMFHISISRMFHPCIGQVFSSKLEVASNCYFHYVTVRICSSPPPLLLLRHLACRNETCHLTSVARKIFLLFSTSYLFHFLP